MGNRELIHRDILSFVREEFGEVRLGDARLDRRLGRMVADLAEDPGRSIPQACGRWAGIKAAYRFCANSRVTRSHVMTGHFEATAERAGRLPSVLVVEDTTSLNFTHHPATQGLGKIGNRCEAFPLQGVLVHSALAVEPGTHRLLGLLSQDVIVRKGYQSPAETRRERQQRPRESAKWMNVGREAIERAGSAERVVFVFDREGDIYEVLQEAQARGARYVIRAAMNRRLKTPGQHLLDEIRQAPERGRTTVRVPARGGRPEREADVSVRTGRYVIGAPSRLGRASALEVNAVRVWEQAPPEGAEGLDWVLLTSEPVASLEQAMEVVGHYRGRWTIEEWHKALKTGCRIEARELETWDRLEVMLGILSVLAWRLVALRDQARQEDAQDPETITPSERAILRRVYPSLTQRATTRDYVRAIAALGGFIGRKRDGDPGWITLWRGLTRLKDMELGYQAASGGSCG